MKNNFRYTTAIRKIRKMTKRIKVIPGGSSAGKTIAILMVLIDKAIKYPNISISVVSENVPHLRRGAMRDFLKIMKGTNRFISQNWNISNSIYTFTNG
jgi:phage terminase large subunit